MHAMRAEQDNLCAVALVAGNRSWRADSAGRMGGVSDTAQLPRFWSGLGVVSGLGPGLTRYSADLPGLAKRPGFTGPTASRCVPSLNRERGRQ